MKERGNIRRLTLFLLIFVMLLGVFLPSRPAFAEGTKLRLDLTSFKITDTEGNVPPEGFIANILFKLKYKWEATNNGNPLKEGDYFELDLPEKFDFRLEPHYLDFDIIRDGNLVAKAKITPNANKGGKIRVTFTDYVNGKPAISGDMHLTARWNQADYPIATPTYHDVVSGNFTEHILLKPWIPPNYQNEVIYKTSGQTLTAERWVRWRMRINAKQAVLNNVVIKDNLRVDDPGSPEGIEYVADQFILYELEWQNGNPVEKNPRNVSADIVLSADKRSFTYNMGKLDKKSYMLHYRTTYRQGLTLRNTVILKSDEVKEARTWGRFHDAENGGGIEGDLTSKIKLIKVAADDEGVKLPNAKFKITRKATGASFTMVTGANGEAVSMQLLPGEYEIEEIEAPDKYIKNDTKLTVTVAAGESVIKTITNEPHKTKVKVKKQWIGFEGSSIKAVLWADGVRTAEKELSAPNWEHTFDNLRKYDKNTAEEIVYTVTEEPTPTGYEGSIEQVSKNSFVITNKQKTIDIHGEKTWIDNDDAEHLRPDSITVILLANGHQIQNPDVRPDAQGKWKYSFEGLQEYDDEGNKITYTIKEEDVPNYTGKIDGYNITNTLTGKRSVRVNKIWADNDDQDGVRPGSVTVKLFADGVEVAGKTITLNAANNWEASFDDLDEYKDGKRISYSVEEEPVGNGYESEVEGTQEDGFTITNTRESEKVTVEGEKTWNDNDDQDGKRPTEIKINLMKKVGAGPVEKIGEKTVTAADGWKWKFENLAKFEGGVEIVYTIEEEAVEGYEAEVDGYNVTNTHEVEKTRVEVTKVWEDNNDKAKKRPSSVTVRLFADGEYTGKTTELNKDGNWQGSFENLDKYKAGSKIKYTVKEEAVGNGYESEVEGTQEDGFTITNTRKPDDPPATVYDPIYVELLAEKKLANGKLKAGQFTFELYKGTKLADTVSNDASGKVTFKSRKFTSPATVKYTIKEVVGSDTKRISYDGTIYTITVKVTDVGGKLVPSISYERDGAPYGGKLQFVNRVKPPKTGDSYTGLPLVLAMVSMLSLAATGLLKKKRHQNK